MKHIIVNPYGAAKRVGYGQGTPHECWPWRGSFDPNGYGQVWNRRTKKHDKAHRVVWEQRNGKALPPKSSALELHHTCHNRWCVNPDHLELVAVSKNRLGSRNHPGEVRPVRHGKVSSYVNRKCRCQECKDAWAAYQRQRRRAKKGMILA